MNPLLNDNDLVLVLKQKCLITNILSYTDSFIKRNDTYVCYSNGDKNATKVIKQCIGIPGDIIEINNMDIYVNQKNITNHLVHLFRFRVYLRELTLADNSQISYMFLTISEQLLLSGLYPGICFEYIPNRQKALNFNHNSETWKRNDYGPLKLLGYPELQTNKKFIKVFRKFLMNNSSTTEIDKKPDNCYFFIGTNIDLSWDSRSYGPVYPDDVYGKYLLHLFRNGQNTLNDRLDEVAKMSLKIDTRTWTSN